MGLKKGGRIRGPKDLKDKKVKERMKKLKEKLSQKKSGKKIRGYDSTRKKRVKR
jgi:hypothetical protein